MTELIGSYRTAVGRVAVFEQEIPDRDGITKLHLRTRLLVIGGLSAFLWTAIVLGVQALINLAH